MPELPEVEVVRAGLAPAVTGARVVAADVLDARALKRHTPELLAQVSTKVAEGGDTDRASRLTSGHGVRLTAEAEAQRRVDFEGRMTSAVFDAPLRRGKFLWLPLQLAQPTSSTRLSDNGKIRSLALLAHLGMSGQLLLRAHDAPDDRHVRIRMWIEHAEHGELRVDFADQRLFGSLAIDQLVTDPWARPPAEGTLLRVPAQASHIAPDPLEKHFDDAAFVRALRLRKAAVKRAILDQRLVSGVGNIYADEALWRARLHPETPGVAVSVAKARGLLDELRGVFARALAEGGTSFDAQYVNVNGEAGYFAHSLNAYGRGGEPCPRCGTAIKRVPFGGRSSHFCPRCQRKR